MDTIDSVTPTLVKSYPERIFGIIPLPLWLSTLLFWEIIFLTDYLIALPAPQGHEHILVFGLITLFFASICIGTSYCSRVFHGLYPHLGLFIDEPKEKLFPFFQSELKKCYQGVWPILAGIVCATVAFMSFQQFIVSLSPAGSLVVALRIGYITFGFFFLGISLWAMVRAIKIPMNFTQFKIKVSTHQFAGSGLQALGGSFFKMSITITITFLIVVGTALVSPYAKDTIVLLWFGLGAVLIFGFFLLPQVGIHQIMSNEKSQRMQGFSVHLEEALERSLKNPSAENMQRLKELFELQQHLKSMNEWPFDMNSVWQLVSALLIPLALAALEIIF